MAKKKPQKKQNTLGIVVGIIAAIIAFGAMSAATKMLLTGGFSTKSVDDHLADAAKQLNLTLPKMLDAVTRMDSTAALPGKKLQYKYTILHEADHQQLVDIVNSLRPAAVQTYKTHPSMVALRNGGVTLVYTYSDSKGQPITTFEITPQDIR